MRRKPDGCVVGLAVCLAAAFASAQDRKIRSSASSFTGEAGAATIIHAKDLPNAT